MINQIKNNLKELGFKENEIKIYIASTQLGEASAAQIAKKVDLPRTTVISILQKLEENNFISTHKHKGTTYFWIESPRLIKEGLENKVKIAENLDNLLSDLYRSEAQFPFAKVYDTKSSIKNYIEKSLISARKKSTIYTVDNPDMGNYRKIFSDDYGRTLVDVKNKRQITTNTLIPYKTFKTIDNEKLRAQNIIIRELPPQINAPASYWVMDNRLIHFSGKIPFLVEINHKLIVESMRSIYDYLWKISTPMN